MNQIICKSTINSETFKASISGLREMPIEIDYSEDIDLTLLIKYLTEKIDGNSLIDYSHEGVTENSEKELLLIETLKSIFDSFNESASISETINEAHTDFDNSELPF